MSATLTARFSVPADHPCLPGHFPGRPVVPAVLLLDEVITALQAAQSGHLRLEAVAAAKFVRAVQPGETVEVDYAAVAPKPADLPTGSLLYTFNCSVGTATVASGRLKMRQPS